MKLLRVIAAALVISSVACSGISVNQDFNPETNFSSFQTWGWMPSGDREGGDPRSDNALVDQRIRSAIESQMRAKGFQYTASGNPSFRVGYHLILDEGVDYQTVNNYWGGGWRYGRVYGPYRPAYATSQTYATEFTQGTLIIDFFDEGSKELVWRGSAEGKIHETNDPQEKQDRANLAVQKILDQYPPMG